MLLSPVQFNYNTIFSFTSKNKGFCILVKCNLELKDGKYYVISAILNKNFKYDFYDNDELKTLSFERGTNVIDLFKFLIEHKEFKEDTTPEKIYKNMEYNIIYNYLKEQTFLYDIYETNF